MMRKSLLLIVAAVLAALAYLGLGLQAEYRSMALKRQHVRQERDSIADIARQQQLRQDCAAFISSSQVLAQELSAIVARQRKKPVERTNEYALQLTWARVLQAEGKRLLASACGQDSAFLYHFNRFSAVVAPVLEREDRRTSHRPF